MDQRQVRNLRKGNQRRSSWGPRQRQRPKRVVYDTPGLNPPSVHFIWMLRSDHGTCIHTLNQRTVLRMLSALLSDRTRRSQCHAIKAHPSFFIHSFIQVYLFCPMGRIQGTVSFDVTWRWIQGLVAGVLMVSLKWRWNEVLLSHFSTNMAI